MLSQLNESQQLAAQHIDGSLLILAGAGSGKTKTITTRLAYLISIGIDPSSILTLTFTNKAATQMRHRAGELIINSSRPPLLCTFHKFGLLFLKFNIHKLNRKNNFVIIDTADKKRILKTIDKELTVSLVANEISNFKNSLTSIEDAKQNATTKFESQLADIYEKYETYISVNNLVDFDDLLLLTYKILEQNDDVCDEMSNRYKYIMVDEYQDTNDIQDLILMKLCKNHNNLCVVGDDDQSIYGWRGASIKNILNFDKKFKDTVVIKLENNYRSTDTILYHANKLIEHNLDRLGKKLIGTRFKGDSVKVLSSNNENEEANKIAINIKKLIDSGEKPSDFAILFRVNALSRALEESFNSEKLNYKLVGGIKFYERTEIKDLISYFRLIVNFNDDFSFKRVVNKPKRGIGKVTLDKLEVAAFNQGKSMFALVDELDNQQLELIISKKNIIALKLFVVSIRDLNELLNEAKLKFVDAFEEMIEFKSGYKTLVDNAERLENIDEFYGYLRDYFMQNPDLSMDNFLNEISLQSDQDNLSDAGVSMMSIHACKGLEYKHTYIIGLEEGFFPINGDDVNIEEERRLGYVAFTRAMDTLTVSYVKSRFYKGRRTQLLKSRFLVEALLVKGSLKIDKFATFRKNDLIKHKIFGIGRVLSVVANGQDFKLNINFGGIKRDILSSFVEKID